MDKILFVADVPIENPTSGSEQVINNQAAGLCTEGSDVFAVTRQNGKGKSLEFRNVNGVKEFCYYADTHDLFGFIFSVFKKPAQIFTQSALSDSFDITISHQPFTFFSLLARGKLKDTPSIYVFHSPSHEEYLLSHRGKNFIVKLAQAQIRRLIERYCLRRSQKIIVLSEYMKSRLIKIHKIHHAAVTVNPGGVDLNRFIPIQSRPDIAQELDLPPDKLNLLTVRNLESRMGLDNLLDAVALLKEEGFDFNLIIGGDGPEEKSLKEIVKKKGLGKNVRMVGFIPDENLPKYYGAADFFILPTRKLEGFGLVTVESLACGTPVLGTPVGGTNEILAKLDSDFLFYDASPASMANGIRKAFNNIYKDTEKYDQLRLKCRKHAVKNYSWQRHIALLKSTIEELSFNIEYVN